MPETKQPERLAGAVTARPDARIDVSAQLISLEPGLFSVSVVAPAVVRTEGGMVLPCARFDPLPGNGVERAFVSALAESPLLVPSAAPAYLRVAGRRTSVLLTTYKVSGPMPPPEIHITMVEPAALPDAAPGAAPDAAPGAGPDAAGGVLASEALTLLAHVQNHGDLQCAGGAWAGSADGEGAVEGFAVTLGAGLPSGSIEYQAVLGQDWSSPWMEEGEFCGSRQMALPLLGVRVRLRGQAADDLVCRVWGRFGGEEHGPFEDGAVCEAEGAVLTGLRIVVAARQRCPRGAAEAVVAEPVARPVR